MSGTQKWKFKKRREYLHSNSWEKFPSNVKNDEYLLIITMNFPYIRIITPPQTKLLTRKKRNGKLWTRFVGNFVEGAPSIFWIDAAITLFLTINKAFSFSRHFAQLEREFVVFYGSKRQFFYRGKIPSKRDVP